MVCLGNEPRSFSHFWDCTQYCISDSFVDYEGYSISSKGFLPTVVDIMVIRIKFAHSHPLQFWASMIAQLVKNPSAMQETLIRFLASKIHWRRDSPSIPVFLGFLCGSADKESAWNAGDRGSIHFSSLVPKMSMFTLSISCLTTSNLPWFMDLRFQVPEQYCSLQHWTLPSPPDTSTTEWHFCFNPASSFFLELFLHSSPRILDTYQAGGLICLFIVFMGFSRQEYYSGLPFLSLVDHVLSDPD